jgi:phosphohistidine phosphatase
MDEALNDTVDDGSRDSVRQLWILRHAQAVPESQSVGRDRDRPLSARGRRDAGDLGVRLSAEGPLLGTSGLRLPGRAIVSAAIRTVQTAGLVLEGVLDRVQVATFQSLYAAGAETVLTYLREIDGDPSCVLMVGHNPTVSHLAFDLLDPEAGGSEGLGSDGLATCSLVVIDLAIDGWELVTEGCGALVGSFAPPY